MSNSTQPTPTPSSSLSISPQTPFSPPLATSPTNTSFLKYAAALSKSPNSQPSLLTQRGFNPTQTHTHEHEHDHDHPEHHDSFEFGDYGDLKSKSWTAGVNRRAASISGPAVGGGQGQGQGLGIMNALGGKDAGVMADKAAKGQGVLRRLSLTGSSFTRPNFLSQQSGTAPLPVSNAKDIAQPRPDNDGGGGGLNRSASVSAPGPAAGALRGRRLSESKKRGVSPMGERLLRDHGHF